MLPYVATYLAQTTEIVQRLNRQQIIDAWNMLRALKNRRGRLFILGNGGSAANASHAVNDFRKVAHIEAYAPTDNVAELTAIINDCGWEHTFKDWLITSNLIRHDLLLVLSVGGGSKNTSANLVRAMEYAEMVECAILSIVSCDGGIALGMSDVVILIPVVHAAHITPHAEEFQSVLLHLLVNALAEEQI